MTSVSSLRRLALMFSSRRRALASGLAGLAATLLVAACGGGDDNGGGGSTNMRAINLTTDLATLDLYTDNDKRFPALATDALAAKQNFNAATYSLGVRRPSDGTSLFSESFSLAKDRNYTAVVTGREAALLVRTIPEDEDTAAIGTGKSRVRLFNLTADSAGIDVFITGPTVDIGDTTPTVRLTTSTLADFREFDTGTYRLRITGVGNPTDLRLDVPITLADKKFATLVVTLGQGGALVNATLIEQQGPVTILKNTKSRVRVAAGVDGAGAVVASVAGASITGSLRSPVISGYLLVDAGTRDLTVRVNGNAVRTGDFVFTPGADYTLLAYGTAAAPLVSTISDDNRLPSTTSRAKIRLINGLSTNDRLSMQLDFLPLALDITGGNASTYSTATSSGSGRVDVSSALTSDTLFSSVAATNQPLLQAQGVYTVFMLGGSSTATGVLRRDR